MKKQEHVIYGKNAVREALQNGKRFEKLLIQIGFDKEELQMYRNQQAAPEIKVLPKERLDLALRKVMGHKPFVHQGIVAFLAQVDFYTLEDVLHHIYAQGEEPLLVVLDGITDVRNLGAIARSAKAFGAHALVVPMRNTAAVNPEAVKASAGALSKIMVCKEPSIEIIIKMLHAHGVRIIAADSGHGKPLNEITPEGPTALVLGSEDEGVSPITKKMAADLVCIHTSGEMESLNVSVAAGIILHHLFQTKP